MPLSNNGMAPLEGLEDDFAEIQAFESQATGSVPPEGLGDDFAEIQADDIQSREELALLEEEFLPGLLDKRILVRKANARKLARIVKNPAHALHIIKRVHDISRQEGITYQKGQEGKSKLRRAAERLQDLPLAAAGDLDSLFERFHGLGRMLAGGDKDRSELAFREGVEAAYSSGLPTAKKSENWAWRQLEAGAGLVPTMSGIGLAGKVASTAGITAMGAAHSVAPMREKMIIEGVDEKWATPLSIIAATAVGRVEAAIPVPVAGLKTGALGATGRSIGTAAVRKFLPRQVAGKGIGKGITKAVGTAGEAAGAYLGEVGFEEGVQGSIEEAAGFIGAKLSGTAEGRGPMDIVGAGLEGVGQAAGPMLPVSILGGGMQVGRGVDADVKMGQMRKVLKEGKVPSRKDWAKWGFTPESGMSKVKRKEGVKNIVALQDDIEAIEQEEQKGPVEKPTDPKLEHKIASLESLRQRVDAIVEESAGARTEVQEKADAAKPKREGLVSGEEGSVPLEGRLTEPVRTDIVAGLSNEAALEALKDSKDPGREAAIVKSHNPKESRWSKMKSKLSTAWKYTRQVHEYLPNTEQFDSAREVMRITDVIQSSSLDESVRTVFAITHPLGPTQLKVFERYLLMQNQLRALDMGQGLRHGAKSREAVTEYRDKLQVLVDGTPEIQEALRNRSVIRDDLVHELVNEGMLEQEDLEDIDGYVHQQVLQHRGVIKRSRDRTAGPGKKPFQKARSRDTELGEEYDYNTSYIEPEVAWMSNAFTLLARKKLYTKLFNRYDKIKDFGDVAKAEGISLKEVAKREGHVLYNVPSGMISPSVNISERLADKLQEDIIDEIELTDAELKQVLRATKGGRQVAIPTKLMEQLQEAEKTLDPHVITQMNAALAKGWKAWTLMQPMNVIPYNVRNATGDLSPVFAADPAIFLELAEAWKDIRLFFGSNAALSPALRASRDNGVLTSGFAATELENVGDLPLFRRFKTGWKKFGANPMTYMRLARSCTEFRESLLRHAAFLRYRKQIAEGSLKHYGTSLQRIVENVQESLGDDAAAAHLARNLLGDYGNLTIMGDYLRKHLFYFYAFQEINLKRYPRLVRNAILSGKRGAGVRTGVTMAVAPIVAASAATARIGAWYGVFWAWNNVIMPAITGEDDEENLGTYDKANPHINLGHNSDGTVRIFRNVGALGDLLEWFGINEAIGMLPKYKNGQLNLSDIGKEMSTAWIEKMVNMLRPLT